MASPIAATKTLRKAALAILWTALLASGAPARGESEAWLEQRWGVADGLPVDSINALVQGRGGYLWLATFDGLARFDGVRFEVFRSADDPELPSDRLTTLFEDAEGDLWLTTQQQHLVRFCDGRFTRFHTANGLPDDHVIARLEDRDGTLYFGTHRGVARYRDGVMEPLAPDLLRSRVMAIARGAEGDLWLGTEEEGVLRYRDGRVERFGIDRGLPSPRSRPSCPPATAGSGREPARAWPVSRGSDSRPSTWPTARRPARSWPSRPSIAAISSPPPPTACCATATAVYFGYFGSTTKPPIPVPKCWPSSRRGAAC